MHGHVSNNHSQCLCSVHAVHCVVQKNNREKELLKLQRVQQQQEEEEKDVQRHKGCSAKIANLEATVKQQRQVKLKRRLASPQQNTRCAILTFLISQIIEEMERALEFRQGNEKSGKEKNCKRNGDWKNEQGTMCVQKNNGEKFTSCGEGEPKHRKEEVESAMAAENAHLRKELDRLQWQPAIMQSSEQVLLLI